MSFQKGIKLSPDRLLRVTQAAKQAMLLQGGADEDELKVGLQSDVAIAFGQGRSMKWHVARVERTFRRPRFDRRTPPVAFEHRSSKLESKRPRYERQLRESTANRYCRWG
jgi:hypothetical protein